MIVRRHRGAAERLYMTIAWSTTRSCGSIDPRLSISVRAELVEQRLTLRDREVARCSGAETTTGGHGGAAGAADRDDMDRRDALLDTELVHAIRVGAREIFPSPFS